MATIDKLQLTRDVATGAFPRSVLCLVGALFFAAELAAQPSFSVSISDPSGHFAGFENQIESNLLAAANSWGSRFSSNSSIEITVFPNTSIATASASSVDPVFIRTDGSLNIFEYGMMSELRTGVDPNGSIHDVSVNLSPSYVSNELWFDPAPQTRSDPVPSGSTDAVSVFLHEMGHAIGYNGWKNSTTGEPSGSSISLFDVNTDFHNGNLFFTGQQAQQQYGGTVPLTYGSTGHLGNSSPRPGSDLIGDLMNGVSFSRGTRYGISSLDSAILSDLVAAATGSNGPEIVEVFVRGTGWSSEFLNNLESAGLGERQYGYRVTDLSHSAASLPWTNVDRISLRFANDPVIEASDLVLSGLNRNYDLASGGFFVDTTERVATWTLDHSNPVLETDRITVLLDSGESGVQDVGQLNPVAGDANRDRLVTVSDLVEMGSNMGLSSDLGLAFDPFSDVNADGRVSIVDLVIASAGTPSFGGSFNAQLDVGDRRLADVPLGFGSPPVLAKPQGLAGALPVPEHSTVIYGLIWLLCCSLFGRNGCRFAYHNGPFR